MSPAHATSTPLANLRTRLLAVVVAPLVVSGCWSTDLTQEKYLVTVEPGEPCPPKEAVPTGDVDGDRCHPGTVISVDEGPHRQERETYGGKPITVCEYLVTREKTVTPDNAFCFASGRPLVAGRRRVAPLVRAAPLLRGRRDTLPRRAHAWPPAAVSSASLPPPEQPRAEHRDRSEPRPPARPR